MASFKKIFDPPSSVTGKHAKYIIGRYIDSGGNGAVYCVECEGQDEFYSQDEALVIKFLKIDSTQENVVQKRRERFDREIEKVLRVQDKVEGIIPIYDCCDENDRKDGLYWYVMPRASVYRIKEIAIEKKIGDMIDVAKTIKQLHNLEYSHRDIKPGNLLVYKSRLCLSDFGLAFNPNEDKHLTEINERIGPNEIRPPEFEMAGELQDYDYRVSDVYLFAKTVWMIIRSSKKGFPGEYDRNYLEIGLQNDSDETESIEPLHRMMEGATKRDGYLRISISECINYLESQMGICSHTLPKEQVHMWKYEEKMSLIDATISKDIVKYTNKDAIFAILNNLSGIVHLQFFESGRCCSIISLKNVSILSNDFINLEINGITAQGPVRKRIAIQISDICINPKDKSCEIHLNRNVKMVDIENGYLHINDAINSTSVQTFFVGECEILIDENQKLN